MNKTEELNQNHETISDEILILIALAIISTWLYFVIARHFTSKVERSKGHI
jgi:membrane-associated protease RseP (regulator of RpoE activity)